MAIAKKQAEVTVIARVVATDPNGVLSAPNLTVILDELVIDGTELNLANVNGTAKTNLIAQVKASYISVKGIS